GRMGPLQRPGAARDVNVVPSLAGVGECVLRPGPPEDFDTFLEAGLSRVAIESMLEVITRYPTTESHVQPSTSENVQGRALFREAHRVVKWQGIDQVAEAQPPGAWSKGGDNQVGTRQHAVVRVVMLGEPCFVKAQPLG